MAQNLRQRVWHRANACCEYCRLPQVHSILSFEVDHIIARQHGGNLSHAGADRISALFHSRSANGF